MSSADDRLGVAAMFWGTWMQWAAFAVLYLAAIIWRRSRATHKRLMLCTGIVMSFAGVTRLLVAVGLPGMASLAVALLMLVAMFVYDWRSTGRIQPGTVAGTTVFVAMIASFFLLGQSVWWVGVVERCFGFG